MTLESILHVAAIGPISRPRCDGIVIAYAANARNRCRIFEDLRSSLGEEAAESLAHALGPKFEELRDTVTRAEFRELNATVGRLAEAQEPTEEKVSRLADGQATLAAAQVRTETQVAELIRTHVRYGVSTH